MKIIDTKKEFQTFEGEPLKEGEVIVTLKRVLLTYLAQAHVMQLNSHDQVTAYGVGILVGGSDGELELTQTEYDLLKKIVDDGKITTPQHGSQSLLPLLYQQQAKKLIDSAKSTGEEKETKHD